MRPPSLVPLAVLALTACGPTEDFNGYTGLTGSLSYASRINGTEALCDVDLTLTGTPFTGRCADCEFAFHVEPSIAREGSSADCELPSLWTYVDDDFIDKSGLGYAYATATFDGEPLDNALVAVGELEGRLTSAGMLGDGTPDATVTFDGTDTLAWSFSVEEGYGPPQDLATTGTCDPGDVGLTELDGSRGEGAFAVEGSLPCDDLHVDHWTFEAQAGDELAFYLDTTAADSAFDAAFFINRPDGCTDAVSDDAFTCTYRPTEYDCAGGRYTAPATGTYTLVVQNYGSCTDPDLEHGIGEYRLSVEAAAAPGLTLVEDNREQFADRLVTELSGEVVVSTDGAAQ